MFKSTTLLANSVRCSSSRIPISPHGLFNCSRAAPTARAFSSSPSLASGHSRWSKIRHRKGAADAVRGTMFTRIMVEVHTALRPPNSPDPTLNPRLAIALAKAKEAGVPKLNIEAAFTRAAKLADGSGKNVVFEAIAPGGKIAFIVECVTDNSTRTVARVREIFTKFGGNMTPVGYLFERKGVVRVTPTAKGGATFDTLFETALEGGAEDVTEVEGEDGTVWEAITAPSDLGTLTSLLTSPPHDSLYTLESSELAYIPNDVVKVDGGAEGITEDQAEKIMKCVDMLEEETDVVKVWTNLE